MVDYPYRERHQGTVDVGELYVERAVYLDGAIGANASATALTINPSGMTYLLWLAGTGGPIVAAAPTGSASVLAINNNGTAGYIPFYPSHA